VECPRTREVTQHPGTRTRDWAEGETGARLCSGREEACGDRRKRSALAGEQAEGFALVRPYMLAVPGPDTPFSASLLFIKLCCEACPSVRPDGWRACAAACRSRSAGSKGVSHRLKSSSSTWTIS